MEIGSISLARVASAVPTAPQPGAKDVSKSPFTRLIELANSQQKQADTSVVQLMTNGSGNIHDIVMTTAKADLTFRMVLEIRNRLTEAYQEIMRMQV